MTVAEKIAGLSPQQIMVLKLVYFGFLNKQIAKIMGIHCKTVENYRAKVMRKLECSSVTHLIRYVYPVLEGTVSGLE